MSESQIVLIVDDMPENLRLMTGLLGDLYKLRVASHGERALALAASEPQPDLILLDVMMPEIDGYEVCRRLKADERTKDIPVIFLTARTDPEDERLGLDLGAADYVVKPINPPVLLARVRNHLDLKRFNDLLIDENAFLEEELERRLAQHLGTRDAALALMSGLLESRDLASPQRAQRLQRFARALAQELAALPQYAARLDDAVIDVLYRAAPIYDVGQVGMPEAVVQPASETGETEWGGVPRASASGGSPSFASEAFLNDALRVLRCSRDVLGAQFEKWDGSGGPQGLKGARIPLAARILAVADAYDRLSQATPERPAPAREQILAELRQGRGSRFDPDVYDALERRIEQFEQIAAAYPERV